MRNPVPAAVLMLGGAILTLGACTAASVGSADPPQASPAKAIAQPLPAAGFIKQEIRIVMQPTTNDNTPCLGLAARFSNSAGQVLTFLVVAEGQNVTAKIPNGTGAFVAGPPVPVEIIDTRAGNARVGQSSFRSFKQ